MQGVAKPQVVAAVVACSDVVYPAVSLASLHVLSGLRAPDARRCCCRLVCRTLRPDGAPSTWQEVAAAVVLCQAVSNS
jgi:hypothetical protein